MSSVSSIVSGLSSLSDSASARSSRSSRSDRKGSYRIAPPLESVKVTGFEKAHGKVVYPCFVQPAATFSSKSGRTQPGQRYVVYRRYEDFLQLDEMLYTALPHINGGDVPRLKNKYNIGFSSKSSIVARQEAVDKWVRKLFDKGGRIVGEDKLVRDFFGVWKDDAGLAAGFAGREDISPFNTTAAAASHPAAAGLPPLSMIDSHTRLHKRPPARRNDLSEEDARPRPSFSQSSLSVRPSIDRPGTSQGFNAEPARSRRPPYLDHHRTTSSTSADMSRGPRFYSVQEQRTRPVHSDTLQDRRYTATPNRSNPELSLSFTSGPQDARAQGEHYDEEWQDGRESMEKVESPVLSHRPSLSFDEMTRETRSATLKKAPPGGSVGGGFRNRKVSGSLTGFLGLHKNSSTADLQAAAAREQMAGEIPQAIIGRRSPFRTDADMGHGPPGPALARAHAPATTAAQQHGVYSASSPELTSSSSPDLSSLNVPSPAGRSAAAATAENNRTNCSDAYDGLADSPEEMVVPSSAYGGLRERGSESEGSGRRHGYIGARYGERVEDEEGVYVEVPHVEFLASPSDALTNLARRGASDPTTSTLGSLSAGADAAGKRDYSPSPAPSPRASLASEPESSSRPSHHRRTDSSSSSGSVGFGSSSFSDSGYVAVPSSRQGGRTGSGPARPVRPPGSGSGPVGHYRDSGSSTTPGLRDVWAGVYEESPRAQGKQYGRPFQTYSSNSNRSDSALGGGAGVGLGSLEGSRQRSGSISSMSDNGGGGRPPYMTHHRSDSSSSIDSVSTSYTVSSQMSGQFATRKQLLLAPMASTKLQFPSSRSNHQQGNGQTARALELDFACPTPDEILDDPGYERQGSNPHGGAGGEGGPLRRCYSNDNLLAHSTLSPPRPKFESTRNSSNIVPAPPVFAILPRTPTSHKLSQSVDITASSQLRRPSEPAVLQASQLSGDLGQRRRPSEPAVSLSVPATAMNRRAVSDEPLAPLSPHAEATRGGRTLPPAPPPPQQTLPPVPGSTSGPAAVRSPDTRNVRLPGSVSRTASPLPQVGHERDERPDSVPADVRHSEDGEEAQEQVVTSVSDTRGYFGGRGPEVGISSGTGGGGLQAPPKGGIKIKVFNNCDEHIIAIRVDPGDITFPLLVEKIKRRLDTNLKSSAQSRGGAGHEQRAGQRSKPGRTPDMPIKGLRVVRVGDGSEARQWHGRSIKNERDMQACFSVAKDKLILEAAF